MATPSNRASIVDKVSAPAIAKVVDHPSWVLLTNGGAPGDAKAADCIRPTLATSELGEGRNADRAAGDDDFFGARLCENGRKLRCWRIPSEANVL
jgi:hypothetical protein